MKNLCWSKRNRKHNVNAREQRETGQEREGEGEGEREGEREGEQQTEQHNSRRPKQLFRLLSVAFNECFAWSAVHKKSC